MFIPFLVYVRHFLNHKIVFLARLLAQRYGQPPSSAVVASALGAGNFWRCKGIPEFPQICPIKLL